MSNVETVNITIRSLGGLYAAGGVELNGDCALTLKIRPGEVVAVPEDHPACSYENATVFEITKAAATRPLTFADEHAVHEYRMGKRGEMPTPVEPAPTINAHVRKGRSRNG